MEEISVRAECQNWVNKVTKHRPSGKNVSNQLSDEQFAAKRAGQAKVTKTMIKKRKIVNFCWNFNAQTNELVRYENNDLVGFLILAVKISLTETRPMLIAWFLQKPYKAVINDLTQVARNEIYRLMKRPGYRQMKLHNEDKNLTTRLPTDSSYDVAVWPKIFFEFESGSCTRNNFKTKIKNFEVTWQPWPVNYLNLSIGMQIRLFNLMKLLPNESHYSNENYLNGSFEKRQNVIYSYYPNI